MSLPILPRSSPEPGILECFSQKLDELPEDKALIILKSVLDENPQSQLAGDLKGKVTELNGMLARPAKLSKINTLALQSLRREMKKIVESKISSLTAKQLCREILTEIPPHRISSFVDTVEGFYHQALLEGKAPQEALIFALSKGLLRSMITLPNSDEIEANKELQARIEEDPELKGYICPLTLNLVGSDAVYLKQRVDETGNPRERYHEKAIRDWIQTNQIDPIIREPRTLADIKPDLKGREFVEKKLCALLYPELIPEQAEGSASIEALHSKALLLALAASYPVIQEKPEESEKIIKRFANIVEGMNWKVEEVAPPCFPVIKEFLRQTEARLTDENLEEVKAELIGKLEMFVAFFYEIESFQLSSRSQDKAFKMVGEAIGNGASLEKVMGLFHEYVNSITEEDAIRETFPGCLIGKTEWDTHLGAVEKVPLPPGMLDTLNQDCPIIPGKKVGETHTLVLIPSTVNGQPLTENSLGALVKSKGHFSDTEAGYEYMCSDVAAQHGDTRKGPSHWALMTKDVLPGSRSKRYAEQQAMVATLARTSRSSYEVPGVLDATACIFMNYLASPQDERLFLFGRNPWTFTRCQEQVQGHPLVVGGFAPAGLKVYSNICNYELDGVAALRKFWL